MASDQNLLADLELMQSGHSEQQTAILNAFALGMAPSADAVADAVRELDRLCPPLERREEVLEYLWATWGMMFDIVQSNVQDEVHERLIRILGELQRLERGVLDVWGVSTIHDVRCPVLLTVPDVQSERLLWKDLPMLPIAMDTRLSSRGTFYTPTASLASLTY
jgi:hypothetical protein